MVIKERIDKLLYIRGLVSSREKAQALVLAGKVLVNGHIITKAGTFVTTDTEITVNVDETYVSRGGLKLDYAINKFNVFVTAKVCIDVGSSTGGFTECLLRYGALRVYAVDVGYGQLDLRLRNDPRVLVLEKTNVRYLTKDILRGLIKQKYPVANYQEPVLAVIDVSFISLRLVIPVVADLLTEQGEFIALVKPQFEAGKKYLKKGIVREDKVRQQVLDELIVECKSWNLKVQSWCQSPVKGAKGNIEFFLYLKKQSAVAD